MPTQDQGAAAKPPERAQQDKPPPPAGKADTKPEAPPVPEAPPPAPFVPAYRLGTPPAEEGKPAPERTVLARVTPDGPEVPVDQLDEKAFRGQAPAELWAQLLGHVDPQPTPQMPRPAFSSHQRWIYEAAKVQWGGTEEGVWRPGAAGKLMTRAEYEEFVKRALGAQGTSTGAPPAEG